MVLVTRQRETERDGKLALMRQYLRGLECLSQFMF